jgi:hypothetical protein
VVAAELVPLYHKLVVDDQDSVRLLAVGAAPAFLKALGSSDAGNAIVATLNNSSKVWRTTVLAVSGFFVLSVPYQQGIHGCHGLSGP